MTATLPNTAPNALPLTFAKALQGAICSDTYRGALCNLHKLTEGGRTTLTATNGHWLMQVVYSDPDAADGVALYSLDTVKRYVKSKGFAPLDVSEDDPRDFPDAAQVIPALVDERLSPTFGMSAQYMLAWAQSVKALKAPAPTWTRFQTGVDAMSPIRIDLHTPGEVGAESVVWVLMPGRLS